MVKEAIRIYCRLRPSGRRHISGLYSINHDETAASSLEITVPRDLADGFVNNKRESYKFRFQEIFDQEENQESIFEQIAKPVAESVLTGYNGTIFAYGQTGSGKTFTITGGAERYNDRGIIPRTLSYVFEQFQKDSSKVYTIHISYLEIYNECGYDLLDPRHEASKLEDLPKVTIMEDPDQNIHLKNLSLHQVSNEEEALNLLFLGDTNRMIAETPMNQASTRSHCIFTIHLSSKEPGSATVRRSKLHLVDLAGSERVAKTGVGGQLLTEAKYINLSLHYLEQVIIALAERNRSHIPYRNSMMTSVLRDSLGGNCMTTMIATLSMEKRNIDESISTCRFAQRVAMIKNEALLNEEVDPQLLIIRLKKEIQSLKDELALVTGSPRTDDLTEEEILKLDEQVHIFLDDDDSESTLDVGSDMRKINCCFAILKRLFRDKNPCNTRTSSPEATMEQPRSSADCLEEIKKLRELLQQRDNEINILVSMLKKEKKRTQDAMYEMSHSAGQLRSHSDTSLGGSPAWKVTPGSPASPFRQVSGSMSMESRPTFSHRRAGENMSLGRQEAFEIFKRDYPDRVKIEDNKALLKKRFAEAKSLGEEVNNVRNRINHLKREVEKRRMQRAAIRLASCGRLFFFFCVSSSPDELNEYDPTENELRGQMEDEKKRYKTLFNLLKSLKTEIEHLQLLLEKAKVKLLKDFEDWWSEEASDLQNRTELNLSSTEPLSRALSFSTSDNNECSASSEASSVPYAASAQRVSQPAKTSIPLTGDSQVDADILAFVKARQKILLMQGSNHE